jgi:hypothetical protein
LQPSEPAATAALGGGEDLASAEGEVLGTIPSSLLASMMDVGEGEGELLTGMIEGTSVTASTGSGSVVVACSRSIRT